MATPPPAAARARRSATPFVSGVLAAFVALLLYNVVAPGPPPLTPRDVNDTVAQMLASATPAPAFSAQALPRDPALAGLIQTQFTDANGAVEDGLGSGVIVDDRGDILTSLHRGRERRRDPDYLRGWHTVDGAEVAASQPENDIAVLRASRLPEQLIPATLGHPGAMRVGDEAFVVGHPLGLYGSMSAGVISGLRPLVPAARRARRQLQGLIQIDAAVNPGNSGGPLLNRYGQVIGIVTGLVNPTKQDVFIGIGFAVPINVAGGAAGMPPY